MKAQGIGDREPVADVEIFVCGEAGEFPGNLTAGESAHLHEVNARALADALCASLPAGTLDRMIGIFLMRKASSLVVPWRDCSTTDGRDADCLRVDKTDVSSHARGGRVGRARSAGSRRLIKPEDLTDEMIAGYLGEHCECRPLDMERASHSHDCDDDPCEDVRVALGGRPIGCGYRSTVEAIIHTQVAKRRICDDIMEEGSDLARLAALGKQLIDKAVP